MIKRTFDEHEFDNITNMANCLVVLSGGGGGGGGVEESNHVFECKTCNRRFSSFQALGGHRASHKKPRLTGSVSSLQKPKPKSHECSICGMEFSLGQALGGHMRRHKSAINEQKQHVPPVLSLFKQAPIVKKSNSRRVLCLDLNLTPSENNFIFGNINAPVQCFL